MEGSASWWTVLEVDCSTEDCKTYGTPSGVLAIICCVEIIMAVVLKGDERRRRANRNRPYGVVTPKVAIVDEVRMPPLRVNSTLSVKVDHLGLKYALLTMKRQND